MMIFLYNMINICNFSPFYGERISWVFYLDYFNNYIILGIILGIKKTISRAEPVFFCLKRIINSVDFKDEDVFF